MVLHQIGTKTFGLSPVSQDKLFCLSSMKKLFIGGIVDILVVGLGGGKAEDLSTEATLGFVKESLHGADDS